MCRARKTERSALLAAAVPAIAGGLALAGLFARATLAVEVAPPPSVSVPCAVVEKFGGQVQLLDPSRSHLLETVRRAGVPCGGWVSVGAGWALIHHRDGYLIHAAAGTFIQIPEAGNDPRVASDQVVLYKGQLFAEAAAGDGELRVLTANARARFRRSGGMVVYNEIDTETQLVALEAKSSLENRFQTTRKIEVRAGEATELNFKALRVLPTAPRAVAIAGLRQKLAELHLDEKRQNEAVAQTRRRQERKFASVLAPAPGSEAPRVIDRLPAAAGEKPGRGHGGNAEDENETAATRRKAENRAPAGLVFKEGKGPALPKAPGGKPTYNRNPPTAEDAELREHMVSKMVSGQEAGERILYPDKFYGRSQQISVDVMNVGRKNARAGKKEQQEEQEKAHLIEELSLIRPD